jgi:hypothetical protein
MAFDALASNQLVSYEEAATAGFGLNSGQSNPGTSKQIMTKSMALTMYNLNPSNMSSYLDGQLVPKSAWGSNYTYTYLTSFTSSVDAAAACATTANNNIYSSAANIVDGMILCTDTALQNRWRPEPITYVKLSNGAVSYSVSVSSTGVVSNIIACSVPDTTAPTIPGTLSGSSVPGAVNLTWGASTDASNAVNYEVWRDSVYFDTTPSTNYQDATGDQVTRVYKIRAFDPSGNYSAFGNSISRRAGLAV